MLTLIRSAAPCLPLNVEGLPPVARHVLQQIETNPMEFLWIIPTRRRLRHLERTWAARLGQSACLTPGWQTLEGFVQDVLAFSRAWRPAIDGIERLFLVARAWEQASGRQAGHGLLQQLDRFQRDCQAVRDPAIRPESFRRFNRVYQEGLARRGRLDRMAALQTLTAQLASGEPGLIEWISRYASIFFDGFHRFEPGELDLLAKLAEHTRVFVWLVGSAGQSSWKAVESTTNYLKQTASRLEIYDLELPARPLAALGRRLFPLAGTETEVAAGNAEAPSLAVATAPTALEEVEQIAAQIKAELRRARAEVCPMRLSEVAVIIPGPAYDPLIREVFSRAGLPFNLAGRALDLASSRPARLLLSALAVIGGQWRADLLLDFLMQPVVRRRLVQGKRLHALFEERPRQRQQLDYGVWSRAWKQHLHDWQNKLAGEDGTSPEDDERRSTDLEQEALEQTTRLVQSLQMALEPVRAIEESLHAPAGSRGFLTACIDLLHATGVAEWLTPPAGDRDEPLLAELHKDQQAYEHLLDLWRRLAAMPTAELPQLAEGHTDWLGVAHMALANETYQIHGVDDAGVQIFEIREVRGLEFRQVYMLGLIDGQVPALPEEGALAELRLDDPKLREQLELKEAEAQWSFTQLFESAREKLVLSRPCREADSPLEPSAFLLAVTGQVAPPVLDAPACFVDIRSAAMELGRRVAAAPAEAELDQLWPGLGAARPVLGSWLARARTYRGHACQRELRLELPALLPVVLHDGRSFSPSELEKYAACPFRFFGTRLLRLQERESDTTRLQYGSFVHRVFEESYLRLRSRTADLSPDAPLQPVREEFRSLFSEIFHEEWQKLQQGLLPQELSTLFREERGVADAFLEILGTLEEENGLGNLCTEYEFKELELGHDNQGRSVLMTGVVDRVDLDRTAPYRAFVFDYKTGKNRPGPERQAKSSDGRLLQLALYGYAVGKKLDKEVAGAAYLYLNESRSSRELTLAARIGSEGELKIKGRTAPAAYDVERTRRKALELVNEIRAGNISLTQFMDGKYKECTNSCAMRSACRHEVVELEG
jgi:ATP-dependent helicase/DNAse subunit B